MATNRSLSGPLTVLVGLVCAPAAFAQTTVSIDQAPAQVAPGQTFEVVWTVNSPNPIRLTTVVWGEQSQAWNRLGALRSGPSGTFRTTLTAPSTPGNIF